MIRRLRLLGAILSVFLFCGLVGYILEFFFILPPLPYLFKSFLGLGAITTIIMIIASWQEIKEGEL